MQVIGTAGHVDHGKSTLIQHLTGIHPDRLKQERDREMTIELGFAWLDLPNGDEVGIIDVPGHRDFIENMLAGIGGIDAALFVVAADEGVMPQTREHLAILDLLQVPAGVIALTKIDLIPETEWLDLVEEDLRETLKGTVLAQAPIVRVSARTGEGMDELLLALQDILTKHPHRPDLGRPRLPVDRVFTMSGFGTVVTGTLLDGQLAVGDAVEILPPGIGGRIRGLQTHKQTENLALPGSRTAVNISGIRTGQIERGHVIAHPGTYQPSKMIDVWARLLPDVADPLKHNTEVKLFVGASEVMARARVLGMPELAPGRDGFLQLMLEDPIVVRRQDRFIIRRPSPAATIGGGQIVDAHPKMRHKRFNLQRLDALEKLLVGTPEEIIIQTSLKLGAATQEQIINSSGLEAESADLALKNLLDQVELTALKGKQLILHSETIRRHRHAVEESLTAFHKQYPLRSGMPRERLKSQLRLANEVFDGLLRQMSDDQILVESGALIRSYQFEMVFSETQKNQIHTLLKEFESQPYTPPSVKQCEEKIGAELLTALIETGQLVQLAEDVLFTADIYGEIRQAVITHIETQGSITLAELRDKLNTSRKYAAAILEYLDQAGVTLRQGDVRKLRNR